MPIYPGRSQDGGYFLFNHWQFPIDDIPDLFQFHAFILMNQDIPKASDSFPGHSLIFISGAL